MMQDRLSEPKRFPLITQPSNRSQFTDTDAKLVNCYAEFDPQLKDWNVEQRPGLGTVPAYSLLPATSTTQGNGFYLWDKSPTSSQFIMISGQDVWSAGIALGVVVLGKLGTLPTPPTSKCVFTRCPSTTPYLLFGYGTVNFYTQGSGYTVSTWLNGLVPGLVYLDGTVYGMDINGNIYGSLTLNDPTTPDPLNVIVADTEGDYGVYLAKQLTYVVALKSQTAEFFYDAGNATGSPLAPVPGALLPYGCLNAGTVAELDSNLFWITSSKTHSPQVIMLSNLQPTIISTPAIERILSQFQSMVVLGNAPVFYAMAFKYFGHSFYVVTSKDANFTLVYDISQKVWSQWTDANGNYWKVVDVAVDLRGNWVAQLESGGIIYDFAADTIYPNDAGTEFPVDIITPLFDAGVDRTKMLAAMTFQCDQNRGTTLRVRCTDDDYKTWSSWRTVNLGNRSPRLTDEGSFYRRGYHYQKQGNGPFRIRSVDLQMDIGDL